MKKFLLILMLVASLTVVGFGADVTAAAKDEICAGVGTAAGGTGCSNGSGPSVTRIIQVAVNLLSFIVGIAALIVIIFSGFRYITAAGDSSRISGAKDTLLYAIIGLVIAVAAPTIVRFVLNAI